MKNLGNLLNWSFGEGSTLDDFSKKMKEISVAQQVAILNSKNFSDVQRAAIAPTLGLTIAENGQIISTSALSESQKGAVNSTIGLGRAFEGLGSELKRAGRFLVANPYILIAAAVTTVAIAYKQWHVSVDEAKESLDDINAETKSLKSEMSFLESQITENANAISKLEELASRAELTATEEKELETLKLTSAELELQKQLIQDKIDLQITSSKNALIELERAKKEADDISTAWENWISKLYEAYKYMIIVFNPLPKAFDGLSSVFGKDSTLGKFFNNASDFFGGKSLTEKVLEVDFDEPSKNKALSEYEKYAEERNKLLSENSTGSDWSDEEKTRFEEIDKEYSKYRENLIRLYDGTNESLKYYTEANENANGIYDDRIKALEEEKSKYADILGYIDETISKEEKIRKILGDKESKPRFTLDIKDGFKIIFNEDAESEISKYEEWLETLDEDIINEIRVTINEGSIQQTEEDVREFVKNLQEEGNSVNITSKLSTSEMIDQLNTKLKPTLDVLNNTYQKIFTSDGFTRENVDFDIISDITSAAKELSEAGLDVDTSSFENLVHALTDTSSSADDVQEAINNVASAVISSTGAMDGMDESTSKLVSSMLESLGIANANEVVTHELALSKEKARIATLDLANASTEAIEGLLNEAGAAGLTRGEIYKLAATEIAYGDNGLDFSGRIEKLQELAGAYGDTATQAMLASAADRVAAGHGTYESVMDDMMAQLNKAAGNVNINFSGIGGSGAGKAGKEAADAYLEAFEKELSELDSLKDRGKITEKQYLDALRHLYVKYFNQKKKYLDQYAKYEDQYLSGMKSLYESAFSYITKQIDKRIDTIQKERDAQVESLEAQKKAAEEFYQNQIDAIEDEIKGVDKEIEAKQALIEAINDAADARQREIDLQKAQYDLERMQNQKTIRVYKDGQMVH